MTTHLLSIAAVVVFGASCGKHHAEKCDAKAVGELAATLDKANARGLDPDKDKATIAAASKDVTGKKFAFDGCKFDMQGNDTVTFAAADSTTATLPCAMKGGADGVTEFRHAAMKIGQDKLRLDVSGVIALHGDKDFARLEMTDCEITTHD